MLVAALNEAGMVVARAKDPQAARQEAVLSIRRLLRGIAEPDDSAP